MKQFRKGECCPKCGNKSLGIRHVDADIPVGKVEHLNIICNRCLFGWHAKPLDLDDNMREWTPKDVKIMSVLDKPDLSLTFTQIRDLSGVLGSTVCQRLGVLMEEGHVEKNGSYYRAVRKGAS